MQTAPSRPRSRVVAAALLLLLAACSPLPLPDSAVVSNQSQGREFSPSVGQPGKDVVWVPTPNTVVERMLDLAEVQPGDRLIDLGSGDGKIAIAAALRGAYSLGIEYNPDMVALSRRNAEAAGVANTARFVQGDIFESDFSHADVITLYLLPQLNLQLRPALLKMKPGTRVASHDFNMGDWPPDRSVALAGGRALFWRVPADVMGQWRVQLEGNEPALRIDLTQHYQRLAGRADWGGAAAPLRDASVAGAEVHFAAADAGGGVHRFVASAGHDGHMRGRVTGPGGKTRTFTATRITRSPE